MGFGTAQYDLNFWSAEFFKKPTTKKDRILKKKKKANESKSKKSNTENFEAGIFPKLPDNWQRPAMPANSLTGDISLDETTREIASKLKRTMVFAIYNLNH